MRNSTRKQKRDEHPPRQRGEERRVTPSSIQLNGCGDRIENELERLLDVEERLFHAGSSCRAVRGIALHDLFRLIE